MRHHIWAGLFMGATALGCGTQASEDFSGEVLLQLRGRVTVDPVSAAPDSIPALCFRKDVTATTTPTRQLPKQIAMSFGGDLGASRTSVVHIVDVESRGQFPAEFDIDVYTPPPPESMERLAPDEPLFGVGMVCAVAATHKPLAQALHNLSKYLCEFFEGSDMPDCSRGHVTGEGVVTTQDGSRYYHKTWDCEDGGDSNTCDTTTEGDVTLLREAGGYEGVFSLTEAVQVIYLSEPAKAGSYTAYKAFAPDGLAAGYHVRPTRAELKPGLTLEECLNGWPEVALAEANKLHGTHYAWLPDYWEGGVLTRAPEDVVADWQRIRARLEMEACPLDQMIIEEPSESLSLDLQPRWSMLFANPPWKFPPAN